VSSPALSGRSSSPQLRSNAPTRALGLLDPLAPTVARPVKPGDDTQCSRVTRIPAATEQGICTTRTGNLHDPNREYFAPAESAMMLSAIAPRGRGEEHIFDCECLDGTHIVA
jgi:hypothetical protein